MITSIVKCHLLDEELVKMTMNALDTIYPYSDNTICIITTDSIVPKYFEDYCNEHKIARVITPLKGFPYFVDTGMKCAAGDYVAVLNNDILLPPNWSKKLLGLFEEDTLLVHPKMIGWNDEFTEGRDVLENIDPKEGLFFSAFILNKKLYEQIGWDIEYDYWGYDDWDFYYRARKAGFNCLWTDIVSYKHKGGATISKIGRDKFEDGNRMLFVEKHGINPQDIKWYEI